MNLTQIEEGFYFFVSTICKEWEVFYSVDEQSRPAAPCIKLTTSLIKEVGDSTKQQNNAAEIFTYTPYEITLSLVAYGGVVDTTKYHPMSVLASLTNNDIIYYDDPDDPYNPDDPDEFSPYHMQFMSDILKNFFGLSILNYTGIFDNSGLNDLVYELRARREITFNYTYKSDAVKPGYIDSIGMEGTAAHDEDINNIVKEITIIPPTI